MKTIGIQACKVALVLNAVPIVGSVLAGEWRTLLALLAAQFFIAAAFTYFAVTEEERADG